jgi:hypothetical protein
MIIYKLHNIDHLYYRHPEARTNYFKTNQNKSFNGIWRFSIIEQNECFIQVCFKIEQFETVYTTEMNTVI